MYKTSSAGSGRCAASLSAEVEGRVGGELEPGREERSVPPAPSAPSQDEVLTFAVEVLWPSRSRVGSESHRSKDDREWPKG